MNDMTLEKLVNFCKQYGFIFQGSEIYGGLANTWDYGPLGVELKNNIKKAWRKKFIQKRDNSFELDTTILMHPRVWEASGHVTSFADPKLDCKSCKSRFRADQLISDFDSNTHPDSMSLGEMYQYIIDNKIKCPKCGKLDYTDIRQFNLMFETFRGTVEDNKNIIYLRPENAQGEYVNFLNVLRSMRTKIPFGIGQIGTVFRNEITPGNFTFRTIEFEQMEYQTFCKEGTDMEYYEYFKKFGKEFYMELGIKEEHLRYHDHEKLAFYAKAACDIEYLFPFGWGEINGTHNRTDYDLKRHEEYAGISMSYLDPETNQKYIPYIVESTYGVGRSVLAILFEAYEEQVLEAGESREVLHLIYDLAPYKVCVVPLIKKYHTKKATEIYNMLKEEVMTAYDDTGSIGKRYRRADAIGTPYVVTIDDETLNNDTVTIRDRDSMNQITVKVADLMNHIRK